MWINVSWIQAWSYGSRSSKSDKFVQQLASYPLPCAHVNVGLWSSVLATCTIKEKKRSGRPATINKRALRRSIEANPTRTSCELAAEHHTSHATAIHHLHRVGKSNKRELTVPHELNEVRKIQRVSDCKWLLHKFKRGLIKLDFNAWREVGGLYQQRNTNATAQAWSAWSTGPALEIIIINRSFYCAYDGWWRVWCFGNFFHMVIPSLLKSIAPNSTGYRKRGLIAASIHLGFLSEDNARPHVSCRTSAKIEASGWNVLKHPPYSPDIAPSVFHLFRSIEHFLHGQRFVNGDQVREAISNFFASKECVFYRQEIESLYINMALTESWWIHRLSKVFLFIVVYQIYLTLIKNDKTYVPT